MVAFNRSDLDFILQQILMAEAGQPPVSPHLAFGLREVAGTDNNSVPGQSTFGAADQVFPRATDPLFRTVTVNIDGTIFDPNQGVDGDTMTTSYAQSAVDLSANPFVDPIGAGLVVDTAPRTISNLIADQTANNPAALEAQAAASLGNGYLNQVNGATPPPVDAAGNLFINNVTPDGGLSAPFNSWFTFFGQFFDHGLDLVTKGGSGTVFIPLQPDDPLITVGPDGVAGSGDEVTNPGLQFMVLTRATNLPGADGVLGTADDIHEATNTTTPFVDQNQTYSSHPSHQVFLRDYATGSDGNLHSTGRLLTGADGHSMATWADVKANALKLGIALSDEDVNNVPLLATDAFGNFIPDPVTGMAQIVMKGADGIAGTADDVLVSGTPLNPITTAGAVRTGHAFLNDIAHGAAPSDPDALGAHLQADANGVAGGAPPAAGFYDNELLDAHYIAGDGRANENIGLTAVHELFHSEHNRLIEQTKDMVRAELANGDTSFASSWVLPGADLSDGIQDNEWNGERLFQVAKFGTETQYQHLVFEEFARKVSPNIHLFGNNDIHLDPAITAEFAHVVYRFGHSMLDENVNRYQIGPDGTPVLDANGRPVLNEIGLIEAFLNPLEFAAHGANAAGEIVLGSVNQVGNEIDEFVTGALRNNLLGLPLDLAALNLARGRDTGVAPLNLVRNQIFTELNTGGTNDTTMKPYASWDEFGQFLKHAGSLVNFVAAYGTHASITAATTLEGKRAAALDLVERASLTVLDPANPNQDTFIANPNFTQDAYDFMHSLGAYANETPGAGADGILHTADDTFTSPVSVHAAWSTGSVTGLDNVDLWIGGLAEKQNLFGGLLGSTFNFIFENQMEAIQDADRLYYLPRIEGLHFGTEIENNTFAQLIMQNTGTHHLSANIFMTPEYVVEAGTVTDDPATWLRNPVTGALLVEKLSNEYVDALFNDGQHHAYDTQVHFLGDDNFFGNTMVLGGTAGNDVLIAGQADDDTVWGDGGDDWIDGGNGNDMLFGGTGNDIIRDSAGDDVIHGEAGNDDVDGGLGDDIIFGGDGNDFLHGGNSIIGDEIQGGVGNDIIFGDEGDDALIGNEGDDWIEGGAGGDGLVGNSAAPTGQVPLFAANDVLDGGDQGDKMQGFSGDDIMLGKGGFDKFDGLLGFDWASFEGEEHGVSVDMTRREFIPAQSAPAGDAVRDFFVETEAVSGSAFDDVLGGTDVGRLQAGGVPFVDTFNELTNVNLISGLADFFPAGPVAYSQGNIMLGGDGNDFIEGRGGDDIIDGDAFLHVALLPNASGQIGPGSQILREIRHDLTPGDIDTAVFSDISSNYQVVLTPDEQGFISVTHLTPTAGGLSDGTDRLRNIERLQFSDVTMAVDAFAPDANQVPFGAPTIANAAVVDNPLTADVTQLQDFDFIDGVITNPISFQWQYQITAPGGGGLRWVDIAGATSATFTPTDFQVGSALRVQASFIDALGFKETVASAPTAILVTNPALNHAPTVVTQVAEPGLFDTSAQANLPITLYLPLVTTFTDDTTAAANLIYTATLADGSDLSTVGLSFATTPDGAGGVTGGVITGTPPAGFTGTIDLRVKATDALGLSVTDVFTINVLPFVNHAPVIISDGAAATAAVLVDENTTAVTTVTAVDPDAGTTLTFSIVGGADATLFTIDATTGELSFITAPDFEVPTDANGDNVCDVVVQVSDGSLVDTQAIAVTVANANDPATGVPLISDTTPTEGRVLTASTASIADADGLTTAVFSFQWQRSADGVIWTDITDATTSQTYIPVQDDVLQLLRVVTTFTDDQGTLETLTSAPTGNVGDQIIGDSAAETIAGTPFDDWLIGDGTLSGSSGNDTLTGGTGSDILEGGAGNDRLDGGAGNDIMAGSTGNDTYVVDSLGDVVSEDPDEGTDTVRTALNSLSLAPISNVENLTFTGAGGFVGTGNALNNVITGGTGADTLNGADGSDTLIGGAGHDALTGGIGADKYVFDAAALADAQSASPVFDDITSYNVAEGDQVDLSALLSTAYNHGSGQRVSALVRAVEDSSGSFANLQIDPDGIANGVHFVTIARLGGLQVGNSVNVILDSSLPAGTTITIPGPPAFQTPTLGIASFNASAAGESWSSDDTHHRELADVNGDGMADIVGFGVGGVTVSFATGGGNFAAPSLMLGSFGTSNAAGGWESDDTYPRELADVNGDGMADIVGFGIGGVNVSLATGGGQFAAPSMVLSAFGTSNAAGGWTSDNTYPRELADVNGDGMADIVGFGMGGVNVSLATGGGNFAAPSFALSAFGTNNAAGGWTSDDTYPRELADVNGDGMADIVGFGIAGVTVSLATGGGNFATPSFVLGSFGTSTAAGGWASDDLYHRELTDLNGDGMADIVGFGVAGVNISLATGGGHFAAPSLVLGSFGTSAAAGSWTSNDTYPRELADVTGDGMADIVGFGQVGVNVSLNNSGGTANVFNNSAGNNTFDVGTGNDTLMFAPGFGNDVVLNFDADTAGGQDILDISTFGITSADFAARVSILADANVPAGALITIDGDIGQTIKLAGINVANTNQTDFHLLV